MAIKFVGPSESGKELDSISVELSNPNTFIQSLLKLGSFLHGKTIKFLDNPINYPPVILAPWSTPTIPMKIRVFFTWKNY